MNDSESEEYESATETDDPYETEDAEVSVTSDEDGPDKGDKAPVKLTAAKKNFIAEVMPARLKKLGSCHMEYITSRKKIESLLHPVDDESTGVMVVSSHCLSVNSYK